MVIFYMYCNLFILIGTCNLNVIVIDDNVIGRNPIFIRYEITRENISVRVHNRKSPL